MDKVVAIIATLDTKEQEVEYLKNRIEEMGMKTFLMDSSLRGRPRHLIPDISREEVAKAIGYTVDALEKEIKIVQMEKVAEGISNILSKFYLEGRFNGVISVGGHDGACLAGTGMKHLPLGIPKLIITTVASLSGMENIVHTRDVMVLALPSDVQPLNFFTKNAFDNAAAAIAGMVKNAGRKVEPGKNAIGATMYGGATIAVFYAKEILEKKGYEMVIFVPAGIGSKFMEDIINEGAIMAVLNMITHDIIQELIVGELSPAPNYGISRLETIVKAGTPHIFVPGFMDVLSFSPRNIPPMYKTRSFYQWSPLFTDFRASREELERAGKFVAEKLNEAKAPTAVVFPKRGLSPFDVEGGFFYDPIADEGFIESLKKNLTNTDVRVIELDAHINDLHFGEVCTNLLVELMGNL